MVARNRGLRKRAGRLEGLQIRDESGYSFEARMCLARQAGPGPRM